MKVTAKHPKMQRSITESVCTRQIMLSHINNRGSTRIHQKNKLPRYKDVLRFNYSKQFKNYLRCTTSGVITYTYLYKFGILLHSGYAITKFILLF